MVVCRECRGREVQGVRRVLPLPFEAWLRDYRRRTSILWRLARGVRKAVKLYMEWHPVTHVLFPRLARRLKRLRGEIAGAGSLRELEEIADRAGRRGDFERALVEAFYRKLDEIVKLLVKEAVIPLDSTLKRLGLAEM